jgi:hypothetical protein
VHVKIERRGSYNRAVFEGEVDQLDTNARSAICAILAAPPPAASAPGGDREWYRVTLSEHDDTKVFEVSAHDIPESLATLPKIKVR